MFSNVGLGRDGQDLEFKGEFIPSSPLESIRALQDELSSGHFSRLTPGGFCIVISICFL